MRHDTSSGELPDQGQLVPSLLRRGATAYLPLEGERNTRGRSSAGSRTRSRDAVGDDVFGSPDVLDKVIPARVLRGLAPQSVLFAPNVGLQCPGLVLELDGENMAVLFDPDVDIDPVVPMRDLDRALQPYRGARQAFVYLPGDGVLKVGFGMEYRSLIGQFRENGGNG